MAEVMALEGKLDVRAVGALHAALGTRLDQDLTVDMTGVTQLGALCLQTLIGAATAVRCGGHQMVLSNVSDTVEAQLRYMGTNPQAIVEGI